ncbi:MAG: hypothetical protein HYY95_21720 [Candidatus Rokubacteria bacterium]|nr:hypothetical protein [Candidatus Rokubacteria bacterium]MBI3108156.1 hypothetical protein [Candidatus Rokubacteria bacterium]
MEDGIPLVRGLARGIELVGVGLLLVLNYMTILNAYFISLTPQWLLERLWPCVSDQEEGQMMQRAPAK